MQVQKRMFESPETTLLLLLLACSALMSAAGGNFGSFANLLGGVGGSFGAAPPVADPETAYASQLTQLQVACCPTVVMCTRYISLKSVHCIHAPNACMDSGAHLV